MAVLVSIADAIATVTLNRPEALNSIDPETMAQMVDLWGRIRADDAIRVVILTGAGGAFTSGARPGSCAGSRAP